MKRLSISLLALILLLLSCGRGLRDPDAAKAGVVVSGGTTTTTVTSESLSYKDLVPSQIMRDPGSSSMTLAEEASSAASLPAGYRIIPLITDTEEADNDAAHAYVADCGTSGTIADRIADCASDYPASSSWDGTAEGRLGEGLWKLVTRLAGPIEVWQDTRTSLIWSDMLTDGSAAFTFCEATGSNINYAGNDCSANAQAVCQDVGNATLEARKGNLSSTDGVYWRLPTLSDWKLADINGLRAVFTWNPAHVYWTSTISAGAPTVDVWTVSGDFQYLPGNYDPVFANNRARCVGRVAD
jgi:hypothetical protein